MNNFEFKKSGYSEGQIDSDCVEVATNVTGRVAVRDSKRASADAPVIQVAPTAWATFTRTR
ncbi:DUF397 domain-containing protein [Streptomyces sp. NPDC058157]|uniref:DUF397 domain-containing protein n=1 Tax=Streptomyces sp. NPDC058157 TaxID=3346360 RepID=UPI0036E0CBAB